MSCLTDEALDLRPLLAIKRRESKNYDQTDLILSLSLSLSLVAVCQCGLLHS